jgi:hypothetical protein
MQYICPRAQENLNSSCVGLRAILWACAWRLERRVVGRLLLQLYVGWSQCVGATFAIKRGVFICVTFASYASWKWYGRKFYQVYSSSIEPCRTIYKGVKIIRLTILVLGRGEGCKRNNFYWSRNCLRSLRT